ncbi:hypothetical protein ACFV42_23765 [Streptomyces solisilvae]|uniref:hypothetical protein n=1 Tax=Streptomyces malaysiensis TaxID=92644 RepID=UPI0036948E46
MTAVVMTFLWTVMFACIALGILSKGVRTAIYHRHDRLLHEWADQCRRNQALCGHPGPTELEDFPGMRESWRDIRAFHRFWIVLTSVTVAAGILLTVLLSIGIH